MIKNILINIPVLLVADIEHTLPELQKNKQIGKIFLASWEQEAKKYKSLLNGGDVIIYPNISYTEFCPSFISKKYTFNIDDLDNMDSMIGVNAHRRYEKAGVNQEPTVNDVLLGFDLYNYWHNFIKDNMIEVVYGVIQKHSSSDSMLYQAARKAENVKNIFIRKPLGFSDAGMERYFIFDDKMQTIKAFNNKTGNNSALASDRMFGDRALDEMLENIKKPEIIGRLKKITAKKSFSYVKRKIETRFFFKKLKALENYYESKCVEVDLNKKYILYSVHFEPESTIYPDDGLYSYQLYNLRALSSLLPKGWLIYVKEHPSQFIKTPYLISENYKETLYAFKNQRFYQYMSMISNVEMISISVDQKTLLKNANIIASNSGSVFLEASYYDKPCLAFSKKSFANIFNNVWSFDEISSGKKVLDEIDEIEIKSNYQEVLDKYSKQRKRNSCYLYPLIELLYDK